jgi:hypothetical protein
MKWYYVENGQQTGPVEEAELPGLIQSGRLNSNTLVWHEGMAAWQPFSAVAPPGLATPAAPPTMAAPAAGGDTAAEALCRECGNIFRKADLIQHGNAYICTNCKPVFMQRVREGLSGAPTGAPGAVSEAQVRARDYDHDIGAYLSRAWQMFKADPGLIIGVFLVVGFCFILVNIIPYLSTITGLIFGGPLLGGLFAFTLKKLRNQPATFGDGFSGFGPYFGQLLLGNFIPSLLAGLIILPFVIIAAILIFAVMGNTQGSAPNGLQVSMMAGGGILFLVGICVAIYFQYCWIFALWLIVDKHMTFWPAMSLSRAVVRKHWWQTFLLGIVAGVITLVGALACGVGMLVSAPVAVGMFAGAYERLFGDMQSA